MYKLLNKQYYSSFHLDYSRGLQLIVRAWQEVEDQRQAAAVCGTTFIFMVKILIKQLVATELCGIVIIAMQHN